MFCFETAVGCYLVIVGFTVGQAFPFVVTVSQEGFLTLSTHKMLQTKPKAQHTWLAQLSVTFWLRDYQVTPHLDQSGPGFMFLHPLIIID